MGGARPGDRADPEAGMKRHPLDGLDEDVRDHIARVLTVLPREARAERR